MPTLTAYDFEARRALGPFTDNMRVTVTVSYDITAPVGGVANLDVGIVDDPEVDLPQIHRLWRKLNNPGAWRAIWTLSLQADIPAGITKILMIDGFGHGTSVGPPGIVTVDIQQQQQNPDLSYPPLEYPMSPLPADASITFGYARLFSTLIVHNSASYSSTITPGNGNSGMGIIGCTDLTLWAANVFAVDGVPPITLSVSSPPFTRSITGIVHVLPNPWVPGGSYPPYTYFQSAGATIVSGNLNPTISFSIDPQRPNGGVIKAATTTIDGFLADVNY